MLRERGKLGMRVVAIIDPGIKVDPEFWVYADGVRNVYATLEARATEEAFKSFAVGKRPFCAILQ
jgi:alpha-glucosidase (family GH31 glycosyl hydrolase)